MNFKLFAVTQAGPRPLPVPAGANTIHDLFGNLAVGVYTSFRTYGHNRFLHLEDHLDRLERSMAMIGLDQHIDRRALCLALHQVCTDSTWPEARVRLDVLARPAIELVSDSRVLIALSAFQPNPERIYQEGVPVGIARQLKRSMPLAKNADFVPRRQKILDEGSGYYEYLMLDDDGYILEGTTSNFYGLRQGEIWTAGQGVLEGVARKIVLLVAAELGIPIRFQAVHLDEVNRLDEAAMSSSSRAIVPVVNIEERQVCDGRPGPLTRRLLVAYRAYEARNVRTAVL